MHLPYEISLPTNVHKNHIEMTILSYILSSILFPSLARIDKRAKKKEGKKEDMNKDNDAWGVQDEWEMKLKQKTKYLKNTILQSI